MNRFQPVTLTFLGPSRSEAASTFLDHRFHLKVTTPSGEQLRVPGFFAADGEAANTSAAAGDRWRVRILPLETGTYAYAVSFRCGEEVAVSLDENAGTACAFDGERGRFSTTRAEASAPGHYARGLLRQEEPLMRFANGKLFIKGGSDSRGRRRDPSMEDSRRVLQCRLRGGGGTTNEPQDYAYRVDGLAPGRYVFRLRQLDYDGTETYHGEIEAVVRGRSFTLRPVAPNPFRHEALLRFAADESQPVRLELFSALGRRVRVLYQGTVAAHEEQTVPLQAHGLASGLYVVRLTGAQQSKTQTVVLVK